MFCFFQTAFSQPFVKVDSVLPEHYFNGWDDVYINFDIKWGDFDNDEDLDYLTVTFSRHNNPDDPGFPISKLKYLRTREMKVFQN